MTDFDMWKWKYKMKWCFKEHLQKLVELRVLTATEYKEITGEDYVI